MCEGPPGPLNLPPARLVPIVDPGPTEQRTAMCIVKTLFRTAVIGTALSAAVIGGSAMLVGPDRTRAMVDQVTDGVRSHLDAHIDDPAVLRRKLTEVSAKYPEQIAQVRSDLTELREEVQRLEHERKVSERVVELIDQDLDELRPALAEASDRARTGNARLASVAITFDGDLMSLRRAKIRAGEIERERTARAAAAADAGQSLIHLRAQEQRFEETLTRLLDEQAELQAKVRQIESEIETVARTERLIQLLEKRDEALRNVERFQVESLDGLTTLLERKRVEQEARLDAIGASVEAKSYEALAEAEVALERVDD